MTIVAQEEQKVKCTLEWCDEDVFREGLCWPHFIEDKEMEWDNQDAERENCQQGVGYIFGDHPLDGAWWGDDAREVCGEPI